jgi:hypothetical protein
VANNADLLTTTLSNGGKGGFVYEQDNGALAYSSNGDFSHGGGMFIATILTNGATPWTFDATKFVQV